MNTTVKHFKLLQWWATLDPQAIVSRPLLFSFSKQKSYGKICILTGNVEHNAMHVYLSSTEFNGTYWVQWDKRV